MSQKCRAANHLHIISITFYYFSDNKEIVTFTYVHLEHVACTLIKQVSANLSTYVHTLSLKVATFEHRALKHTNLCKLPTASCSINSYYPFKSSVNIHGIV